MSNPEHLAEVIETIQAIEKGEVDPQSIKLLAGFDLSEADLCNLNLPQAILSGANLRGARLGWTILTHADLRGADLTYADMTGIHLAEADLRGARMKYSNLVAAHLVGTDFRGADLRGADLRGADLRKARFAGAELRDANLRGARLNWYSMPLIGEILARHARTKQQRKAVAQVLGGTKVGLTWNDFADHPLVGWMKDVLRAFEPEEGMPSIFEP